MIALASFPDAGAGTGGLGAIGLWQLSCSCRAWAPHRGRRRPAASPATLRSANEPGVGVIWMSSSPM